MKLRIFLLLMVFFSLSGLAGYYSLAQNDADKDNEEIVVQTMGVNANSPSDTILSALKYSYSEYLAKSKTERTFDLTVTSVSESKAIENFTNQEVSNVAINRVLSKSEIDKFVEKNIKAPKVIPVFKIPIIVLIHTSNTVKKFDFETLKKIFTGEIKSWKELDEEAVDDRIELVLPPEDTGAYRLFKKVVLEGEEFSKEKIKQENEKDMVEHVKLSGARIGFASSCYAGDNQRVVTATLLKKSGQIYRFLEADVKSDSYPLIQKMYFYYTEDIPQAFNLLVDFAKKNPTGLNSYRHFKIVTIN